MQSTYTYSTLKKFTLITAIVCMNAHTFTVLIHSVWNLGHCVCSLEAKISCYLCVLTILMFVFFFTFALK